MVNTLSKSAIAEARKIANVDDLRRLLMEAGRTERKLPAALRLGIKSYWPDIPSDPELAYGYNQVEVRVGPASSAEISRYHLVLELIGLLDVDDRKLVWAAAHSAARRARGPHWVAISKVLGVRPHTVRNRYSRAILELWYKVQQIKNPRTISAHVKKVELEIYTVAEVMDILGLSINTVYKAIHAGEIPSIKIGGKILIPRRQLERLINGETA